MSRFRLSLLELLGLITAICLAMSSVLYASKEIAVVVGIAWLFTVVLTCAVGIGRRNSTLLSFAMASYLCFHSSVMLLNTVFDWLDAVAMFASRAEDMGTLRNAAFVLQYEFSFFMGLLSAWITRSTARPEGS
jgi:hypothetical protein